MSMDPLTIARFMVMPGASELVEAFSQIPPGPLRDSVIHHAQVIAGQYIAAPPEHRMPDPLLTASQGPQAPQPLRLAAEATGRRPPRLLSETKDGQAVELTLRGEQPTAVAEQLDMELSDVFAAIRDAKKGGVEFPPSTQKKHHRRKSREEGLFIMDAAELGPTGVGAMTRAARQRGITLNDYLARRRLTVEMGKAGHGALATATATKETETVIKSWFVQARNAGHKIPYEQVIRTAEVEEPVQAHAAQIHAAIAAEPEAETASPKFWLHVSELSTTSARRIAERTAAEMGLDLQGYAKLRRKAVAMFRRGAVPSVVFNELRLKDIKQASNWKDKAQVAGLIGKSKA